MISLFLLRALAARKPLQVLGCRRCFAAVKPVIDACRSTDELGKDQVADETDPRRFAGNGCSPRATGAALNSKGGKSTPLRLRDDRSVAVKTDLGHAPIALFHLEFPPAKSSC